MVVNSVARASKWGTLNSGGVAVRCGAERSNAVDPEGQTALQAVAAWRNEHWMQFLLAVTCVLASMLMWPSTAVVGFAFFLSCLLHCVQPSVYGRE